MNSLNEFEKNLLLYAKHHYRCELGRLEGARVIVGHIAGIAVEDTRPRDLAHWFVNVLVLINDHSPRAIPGGLAHALKEFLDHVALTQLTAPSGVDYWEAVAGHLMGQVTITRLLDGETVLIPMPAPDPEIQAVLDQASAARCEAEMTIIVPTFYGQRSCVATVEQIARLKDEKEQVFAELLGLETAAEYRSWYESEGTVYCSGNLPNGQSCRNHLPRFARLDPVSWKQVKEAGGFCRIHE